MKKAFEKIIENELLFAELSSKQFSDKSGINRENVKETLAQRGVKIRQIISETNELIEKHITPFLKNPESATHEEALQYQEMAKRLSGYKESIDTGLSYDLRDALTRYAKSINNDEMFIENMFFKGLALFYLDRLIFKGNMSECYDSIIAFSDRYEEFSPETRNLIVRAYGNSYISVENLDIDEIFRRFDRAFDFWTNTAKRIDPEFPWAAYYSNIDENICSSTITVLRSVKCITVKDEYKQRLLNAAQALYQKVLDCEDVKTNDYTSAQVKCIYYYTAARYYNNLITIEELLDVLLDLHKQADDEYTYDDVYKKLHISGMYLYYLYHNRPIAYTEEDVQRIAKEIEADVFKYVENMPESMSSEHTSNMLTNFAVGSHNIFDDYTYLKLVLSLTVFRHTPTYVHSVMVSKISFVLSEYVIKYMPELFLNLPGITCVQDVRDKSAEILLFVWFAGLVHDIGKISYSHLVSFYARKLNDKEFEMIKQHSLKAEAFIKKSPSYVVEDFVQESIEAAKSISFDDNPELFACFADVAYGHHKSYDGKFGYPPTFDNLKSPVKQIIDIITIADSIDAATDSVGRSYAHEKTLEDMRDDLLSQIHTRYCPVVTSAIFEDERLYKAVENLLTVQRYDTYHSCFSIEDLTETMVPPRASTFLD